MKHEKKVDFKSLLVTKLHKLQLSARKIIMELKDSEPQSPTDDLDRSSLETDQNMTFMIHDRERLAMSEIENALSKIEQGVFGLCETCGCEIDEKRLRVFPSCRLCVQCRKRQEENDGRNRLIFVHDI